MKLKRQLIDTLASLGWDAKQLSADFPSYYCLKVVNTLAHDLCVGAPKGEARNCFNGERIVLFCDLDEAKVERKVINVCASGWEKQIFLWHAKATFAVAAKRAEIAAEEARIAAKHAEDHAACLAYFGLPPDTPIEKLERCFDVSVSSGDIYARVAFAFDAQPPAQFKDAGVRRDKLRRLAAFLQTEGWM